MTKECGVQVNVNVDKTVQCSLGPKTLFCSEGVPLSKSPKSPGLVKAEGKAPYSTTPVSHMRSLRPVSIYSPVFDRRISRKKLSYADESEGEADESVDHVESGHECEKGDSSEEDTGKDFKTTFHRSTKGSSFQFLEQRYGFFHCKKCNIRVEPILCKDFSQTTCNCEKKLRHINMKKPHRQDLFKYLV
ncbi:hypothetical protein KUCAC02_031081 [Chaenocephalus aceratus]|uniref:Uncharacterized protein n=1 Tax=Chaenocephalus aceratus TaxID=36190 RepID=A0ACB9XM47_CHAAC|nr:hypothetical protein KUCAC02_031081 [Chaenocephalus aceratus]